MNNILLVVLVIFPSYINAAADSSNSSTQEADIEREEFEMPLLAKIVPNVVNPPASFRPPEFSAVIYKKEKLVGSGAILNKHYLITLCSLLQGDKIAPSLRIARPVFNASKIETLISNISATSVVLHPDCGIKDFNPAKNLGIIRTKEPMENIRYPKLPTAHIPEEHSKFVISNFRVHNHAATTIQTTFWYIITKRVDNSICAILFTADNTKCSLEGNLCMAYYHLGDSKFCKGDVGSPLSIRYNDDDILAGINLHKHDCGRPREAAAFVCIKTNKDWIEKTIKG